MTHEKGDRTPFSSLQLQWVCLVPGWACVSAADEQCFVQLKAGEVLQQSHPWGRSWAGTEGYVQTWGCNVTAPEWCRDTARAPVNSSYLDTACAYRLSNGVQGPRNRFILGPQCNLWIVPLYLKFKNRTRWTLAQLKQEIWNTEPPLSLCQRPELAVLAASARSPSGAGPEMWDYNSAMSWQQEPLLPKENLEEESSL